MRKLFCIIVLALSTVYAEAQELNCRVQVNSQKIKIERENYLKYFNEAKKIRPIN